MITRKHLEERKQELVKQYDECMMISERHHQRGLTLRGQLMQIEEFLKILPLEDAPPSPPPDAI